MDPDRLSDLLMRLRAGLGSLYGDRLARVILYGSQARGDAHDESDVDVAVVLHGEVNAYREIDRTSDLTTDLMLEFGVFVSVYALSQSDFATGAKRIVPSLLEDGILQ